MVYVVAKLIDYKLNNYKLVGSFPSYLAAKTAIRKTLKAKGQKAVIDGPDGEKLRYCIHMVPNDGQLRD